MIKQKCLTVNLKGDSCSQDKAKLNELLDNGWKIIFAIPILSKDTYYRCSYTGAIQYILEQDVYIL